MPTQRGELLWTPSTDAVERSNMTRYMRWLEAERGLDFGGDYHALWRWSVDELEDFWASIWDYFEVRASTPCDRVLAGREMPGAEWFTGARLNYAENLLAGKPDDRLAVQHASELRELDALTWGELREQVARTASALRGLGVAPGDRVVAYLPNIPETLVAFLATASIGAIWSSCSPDFGPGSVIDRFAQIEPKVLFCVDGYRYNGRDFDRRDVVADLLAAMPSVEHTVVLPYLDPDPDIAAFRNPTTWDELLAAGEPGEIEFEQVALRPSALGPVLVRDHRPAEGDRPGPRRHPARAAEEARPAPRRAGGRPGLLVHDHRLDDVELPRRRAAHRRVDRPLRRQPRPPGHGRALGPRRERRDDLLRHQRQLRRRLHEGRGRARNRARPLGPALGRLDRLAARARGLSVDLRPRRRRHLAVLDLRRHRRLHRVRRRRADPARLPRRAAGAFAGLRRRGVRRGRERGDRRGRRAGAHRAAALDAALPLGRRGRLALPRRLLRHVSGRLAPRRLDRDHLARHRDHLRALGFDHQPLRRAHGHERDLPRRRLGARGHRRARRRHPAPGHRGLDAAVRRPARRRRAERRASGRARPPDPRAVLAPPRARRGLRDRRGPAHALRQGARGAREAHPDRHPAGAGGLPRLARQPRGAGLVRRALIQARLAARRTGHDTSNRRWSSSISTATCATRRRSISRRSNGSGSPITRSATAT